MGYEDRIKPLDEIFSEKMEEFESGMDKEYDHDLDKMIQEFGGYER